MDILITGKKIENADWNEINDNQSIGDYYSQDRYFTLLNEFIDSNLKKYARFLFFIISYMMRSSNFKHETSISNGKSWAVWLLDIFCWLSIIAFFICLSTGIAAPIVKAFNDKNLSSVWDAFKEPSSITLLSIALITFVVSSIYLYMLKFVISKNKKLNLTDYVFKKIDYVLKFSIFMDVRNKFFQVKGDKLAVVEKVDDLNNINRWITLQVNNLMFRLFNNFNVVLKFEGLDDNTIAQLTKIIECDFKNLQIINLKKKTKRK